MDVFLVGFLTLLAVTAVFYIILFGFIYYWHLKKITVLIVPAIFAFEVLFSGFIVVAIVSLVINYLPSLFNYL